MDPLVITEAELVGVFTAWERAFRHRPVGFAGELERPHIGPRQWGTHCASYFVALLEQNRAAAAAEAPAEPVPVTPEPVDPFVTVTPEPQSTPSPE